MNTDQIKAYRIHFIDAEGIKKCIVAMRKELLPSLIKVKINGGVIVSVGLYNMRTGETTFALEDKADFYKVTWFDYVKQETFTRNVPEDQLKWLEEQKHIEIEKVEEA